MSTRVALGALVVASAAGVIMTASPASARVVTVQGTVAGSYSKLQTNPDAGPAYRLTAHGHTSLGATSAKGRVQAPGNVRYGHCMARLSLSTSKGTLVVAVSSQKRVNGFASCQSGFAFNWHTVKASGGYEGASPSGTGTLTLVKPGNASQSPPPAYVTFDPEN
jgi:hypothetical protein